MAIDARGHVAFALTAGGAVALLARHRAARVAGALYPALVVALILVTANHYWLDAVGGALVLGVGYLVARARPTLERWPSPPASTTSPSESTHA